MGLCKRLLTIQKSLYKNRKKIYKKDRKIKQKTYERKMRLFRRYMSLSDYVYFRWMMKNSKVDGRKSTRNLMKHFFKFDCTNVFHREHYSGLKLRSSYKKISELSMFRHDKKNMLDSIILNMITSVK